MINKKVFILYSMDGCAPCEHEKAMLDKFDKTSILDADKFEFVSAKYNDDKDKEWMELLKPVSFPVIYCIDKETKEIKSTMGGYGCVNKAFSWQGIKFDWEDEVMPTPPPVPTPHQPVIFTVQKPKIAPWHKLSLAVFSPPEVDAIVSHMSQKELKEAGVGVENGGVNKDIRRSKIAWIDNNELPWVNQKIVKAVNDVNEEYFNYDLTGMYEQTQYTTYDGDDEGFYDTHMDYGVGTPAPRKLSIIVLLTDQHEYEGGEVELFEMNKPTTWKLSKGDAIVFPSFLLHKVKPVTKGHRISLVQWVHGPDFR